MLNKASQLALVSATFVVLTNFPMLAGATIPQTTVQENFIEGDNNTVNQKLHQTIVLKLVEIPGLEDSVIPNLTIQNAFIPSGNTLNQKIDRTIPNFFSFNKDFSTTGKADRQSSDFMSFGIENFLNSNGVLNGIQFGTQETLIDGNNNLSNQNISQNFTQLFLFNNPKDNLNTSNEDSKANGLLNFDLNQIIKAFSLNLGLDSWQFGLQDNSIFGNNNSVSQEIDQTITDFLLVDGKFSSAINNTVVKPIQFTIQETFIPKGKNNTVNQEIEQNITDLSVLNPNGFSNSVLDNNNLLGESVNFDIDKFINIILNETVVNASQISRQAAVIEGDNNRSNQAIAQTIGIPEPLTILGTGTALGMGAFFKRQTSKKQKEKAKV